MQSPESVSYLDLRSRYLAYVEAARPRNVKLALSFAALPIAIAAVLMMPSLSAGTALLAVAIFLGAIAGLALYIVLTANGFRRRHGVSCPSCGRSLIDVLHSLNVVEAKTGVPWPGFLECPKCATVFAKAA